MLKIWGWWQTSLRVCHFVCDVWCMGPFLSTICRHVASYIWIHNSFPTHLIVLAVICMLLWLFYRGRTTWNLRHYSLWIDCCT